MKNNIKNKILIILLIFLLLMTIYSNVFAKTDFDDNMFYPDGITPNYSSSDGGRYATNKVLLLDESSGTYYILIYYSSEAEATHENQKLYLRASDNFILGTGCDHYQLLKFVDGSWTYVDWSPYYDLENNKTTNLSKIVSSCSIVSTSSDIYTNSSYTDVFFPLPPVTLEEIMKQEMEQKATMKEILGILPMILSVLVSLLALRKALAMLLNLLRQS